MKSLVRAAFLDDAAAEGGALGGVGAGGRDGERLRGAQPKPAPSATRSPRLQRPRPVASAHPAPCPSSPPSEGRFGRAALVRYHAPRTDDWSMNENVKPENSDGGGRGSADGAGAPHRLFFAHDPAPPSGRPRRPRLSRRRLVVRLPRLFPVDPAGSEVQLSHPTGCRSAPCACSRPRCCSSSARGRRG